jgi:hypothetical protein
LSPYVHEPETVCVLIEHVPAPVGELPPAQVGLLLAFVIEQRTYTAEQTTYLH